MRRARQLRWCVVNARKVWRKHLKRHAHSAFGDVLTALHEGLPLPEVLRQLVGDDVDGRAFSDRMLATLEAAFEKDDARRKCFELFLRIFEFAQKHGNAWKVRDRHGYCGS